MDTSFTLLLCLALLVGCVGCAVRPSRHDGAANPDYAALRHTMVCQLKAYRITNEAVLAAMSKVRRHEYIPEAHRKGASSYGDHPWPIGHGQTISQPYIVAYMTEKMAPRQGDRILEIGTGSGYQAAVLAELGAEVFSIEIIPELAAHAKQVLAVEGYTNVHVLAGDGYKGWPDRAPFDAIIVTCAPDEIPPELVRQLADGGRMILPLGEHSQRLVILRKNRDRVEKMEDLPVRFVPMVKGQQSAGGQDGR